MNEEMTQLQKEKLQEKLHDRLKEILDHVNHWLAFAEAKNGAVIAFNMGLIAFVADCEALCGYEVEKYILFIGLFISTFLAVYSFFPNVKKVDANQNLLSDSERSQLNLLFYGDIKKCNANLYITEFCKKYFDGEVSKNEVNRYDLDIVDEIVQNSRITSRKYAIFKWVLHIECFTIVLALFVLFILKYVHKCM